MEKLIRSMAEENGNKRVCVTGGSGYLGSWLVMRLLQLGYLVNTTIRSHPDSKKDVRYLTNLPGAQERLTIFNADLFSPESYIAAIDGCIGVLHVAHPLELESNKIDEERIEKIVNGTLSILQACLDSKTVKRVVYTSTVATTWIKNEEIPDTVDESSWTDVEYVKNLKPMGAPYVISKTLIEKAALEFAERNKLDLVTVLPSWIHGPFITPQHPVTVQIFMSLFHGNVHSYVNFLALIPFVHVDDVANAHIFLLENPNAKGRYICSAVQITPEKLAEFLSTRYPQYEIKFTRIFLVFPTKSTVHG